MLSVILFVAVNKYISSKDDKKYSIAVLPFKDDSPEEGSTYIINGIMEEIINKLEKIEDFEVVSRTSPENCRNTDKNIKTIARELGVNYILEGSGQKIGDKIKLSIQLIESKSDKHLWSKPFIKEVIFENIFELYEEVALSVAEELKV